MDTGGFDPEADEGMLALMKRQVEIALSEADALVLDAVTVRNLELVAPIFAEDAGRGGALTLLAALDETATGMGARLLRAWLAAPLLSIEAIQRRQQFIGAFDPLG